MSGLMRQRAQVGDVTPWSERAEVDGVSVGKEMSLHTLKRLAARLPNEFDEYANALYSGGTIPADIFDKAGIKNAEIKVPAIIDAGNLAYLCLTPKMSATGKITAPSTAIDASSIKDLIYNLVGPKPLIDMMYTSGIYSLTDLQKFASVIAGTIYSVKSQLNNEILAPVEYQDRALNLLTLSSGIKNVSGL